MYRLKVKLRGFDIGTQLCEHYDGSLSLRTKELNYLIFGHEEDIPTFIEHGLIEEIPEPDERKYSKSFIFMFAGFYSMAAKEGRDVADIFEVFEDALGAL